MRPSCAAKAVRYRQFVGFREATSMRLRIVDFARVAERRDPAFAHFRFRRRHRLEPVPITSYVEGEWVTVVHLACTIRGVPVEGTVCGLLVAS